MAHDPRSALKVAVVIPLHNNARHVGAALESLRVQTRPADRVIIIDDGSTDRSLDAIIAYSEKTPVKPEQAKAASETETRTEIIPQGHAGLQATVKRAVKMADDCDYVAILNADDCYHPRRIERCLTYLVAHPQVDLVCTRLRLIDDEGRTLLSDAPRSRWFTTAWSYRPMYDPQNPLDLAEWLGLANFPGTTSNFFGRTAYVRDHPLAGYSYTHGYYALLTAAFENRLGILDAELLDLRVRSDGPPEPATNEIVRETLRMNVDLARRLAPRLASEPDLRRAFARYQRSAWSNVSGFRADLFILVLVEALGLLPAMASDALLAGFDDEQFPELGQMPNRGLVGDSEAPASALGPTGALADRFFGLKAQVSAVRAGARPWAEYRQIQAALLDSRWFALGRLLGVAAPLPPGGEGSALEKLALLREHVRENFWLRFGNFCGVPSARRLRALSAVSPGDRPD